MPIRMAQYTSLLLERLSRPEFKGARFTSVVIYMNRDGYRRDPGF